MRKHPDNPPTLESMSVATINNQQVEVIEYPISDRYCHKGEIGIIRNGQIRVSGTWFNFDSRWVVRPVITK